MGQLLRGPRLATLMTEPGRELSRPRQPGLCGPAPTSQVPRAPPVSWLLFCRWAPSKLASVTPLTAPAKAGGTVRLGVEVWNGHTHTHNGPAGALFMRSPSQGPLPSQSPTSYQQGTVTGFRTRPASGGQPGQDHPGTGVGLPEAAATGAGAGPTPRHPGGQARAVEAATACSGLAVTFGAFACR